MGGFGIPGVVSDRIFGPPPEAYQEPDVGSDIRAAYNWFKSFMLPGEWERRRLAVAKRFYKAAFGDVNQSGDTGRYFETADSIAWYLFLVESILEHPWNYDPTFGARVIPVFASIGRNLPTLLQITGVAHRVRRIVGSERSQPNGGIFELLVAAAYGRAGAKVAFREERPGIRRMHDMDVNIDGLRWAVECKRMETSVYGERERLRMRELWGPSMSYLETINRSVIGTVDFKVELSEVPDDYMSQRTMDFLASDLPSILWDDPIAAGSMGDIDLAPLKAVLETDNVLVAGSRMQELLIGRYIPNCNMLQGLRYKPAGSPRYADQCNFAVILRWECLAQASIAAKARAITSYLSRATSQLPEGIPSVVHIGFETVDGDAVEVARYQKIIESAKRFDSRSKNLQYVYCHYFAPESPPSELFGYDETIQWLAVRATRRRPLVVANLVTPDGVEWREGAHWESKSGPR